MSPAQQTVKGKAARLVLWIAACALLGWVAVQLDWVMIADLGRTHGAVLLLVLLPYVGMVLLDSVAWSALLQRLGARVALPTLVRSRLVSDAVLVSAPAGTLASEAVKPYLLEREAAVPKTITIATLAARLWSVTAVHLGQILIGVAAGGAVFAALDSQIGAPAGTLIAIGAVVAMSALVIGELLLARRGDLAIRVLDLLCRVAPSSPRSWLIARRDGFTSADEQLKELFSSKLASSLPWFAGVGALEVAELWLVARLVGVPLELGDAAAIESLALFLRALVFFVPGGLGFQDASYVGFFVALFGPEAAAAGAAVALLKRAREATWGLVGLGVYVTFKHAPALRPALEEER